MTTTPPLLELPPEVVVHISNFLNTAELGDFRLTCKAIETAVFKKFSQEFFTKRQFMLEQVSLQALVDISKHPVLSKQLSEVIISTHKLPKLHNGSHRLSSALIESGYVDQDVLITTGLARDMLVEAFSNLPNLHAVGLRDFDGLGRYRDGVDAKWRTYGWSYGRSPDDSGSYTLESQSPDTYLPLILLALGKARVAIEDTSRGIQQSAIPRAESGSPQSACSPVHLDVILRKHHKLLPRSFDVLGGPMGKTIKPVLSGIKQLLLVVDSTERYRLDDPAKGPVPRDALANFLHYLPQLEVLRLNFSPADQYADRFLRWFGADEEIDDSGEFAKVAPLSLPNLKSLDLGMLVASPLALIQAIRKYDLTSVNIWKVTIAGTATSPASFNEFLADLADQLPRSSAIRNMSFGFMCRYDPADIHQSLPHPVRFVKDGNIDNHSSDNMDDKAVFRSGHGSSIGQWLKETADRVLVEQRDEVEISDDEDISGEEGDSVLDELEDDRGEDEEESEDEG